MRKLFFICFAVLLLSLCSCGGTGTSDYNSTESEDINVDELLAEPLPSEKYEAIRAAQSFIKSEFAPDAIFKSDGTIVEGTEVPGRFKVLQEFESEKHDMKFLVYRIWVQKFGDSWEYGNLGIENRATGKRLLTKNGEMKDREQKDGVGDNLTVAGISFKIAEKKPDAIRIYTPKKLKRNQLRNVIKELMNQYGTIQFATDAKHERGEDYASWTGGMFFDYDTNEIIGKAKFLK